MDMYVPQGFRGDDYEEIDKASEWVCLNCGETYDSEANYVDVVCHHIGKTKCGIGNLKRRGGEEPKVDSISHPPHYTFGQFEVIDVIEDWQLDFHLANAIKYIARARHKGNFVKDLKKAVWYIQRRIEKEEGNGE